MRYAACERCANSVGTVNVLGNIFLMVVKAYLGIIGRSTALLADAIHSGADLIASMMLVLGLRISRKPSNSRYPWGYGKVEFLVAVVIYTSLICAGVVIFIDAVESIVRNEAVDPSAITLVGALLSIVVNELMYRQSICAGNQVKSPAIIANAWEKRSDALSSIAVFLGIAGAKLGCHFLDPLAAILVAFYIVKFSIEMIIEAVSGLLDSALDEETTDTICRSVREVFGVKGINTIRSRELGQSVWIDLEVLVDGNSEVGKIARLKEEVRNAVLNKLGRIGNVVVYLKPV